MKKNDKILIVFGVVILVLASIGIYYYEPPKDESKLISFEEIYSTKSIYKQDLGAITVSNSNPFYALIATPLAVHYDTQGNQYIKPLYVKDLSNPSDAIERVEKEQIGIVSDLCISDATTLGNSIKEISLSVAEKFWESSDSVLIIENSKKGYELGIVATPIASYLGIPVIVTNVIDEDVNKVLNDLDVEYIIVCGDIDSRGKSFVFENIDDVVNEVINLLEDKFGDINYITLANPLDIEKAEILEEESFNFQGSVVTTSITASGFGGIIGGIIKGIPLSTYHSFKVKDDYKYSKIKITAKNLVDENVDETGSQLQPLLYDPDGEQLGFLFTAGGIPDRDSSGTITEDKIDFETIIYDKPGEYTIQVGGKYLTKKHADYEVYVTVQKLNTSIEPNMPGLSSIAPYFTAYHTGILFAKPEFVFVADESIIDDPSPGVAYPACNPGLIEEVNKHVYEKIHKPLNELIAKISGMDDLDLNDDDDLNILRDYCDESPKYIAIVGDANMIPQYYYYDTPDASTIRYGWDVASDFIYGNVDPVPRDDKISIHPRDKFLVDKYDEKYPHQENIVGRITGWDVQDASALIARTIFYKDIIKKMENDEWKNNAVVQTGSGTDFQRLPVVDLWRQVLGGVFGMHDLPVKWPTGEAYFENDIIASYLEPGEFNVRQTKNTESLRKPLSQDILKDIKTMGLLNRIFFPMYRVSQLTGENSIIYDIQGEKDLENSNYIFSFGHGQPMGYDHGDIQTDSLGIRPVLIHNLLNRWSILIPKLLGSSLTTGLGKAGGYYVRYIENMELGPSVMFIESCYIGRYDGFPAKCLASQAYMHAGLNTLIASSRGSPGPGYLDARKKPVGIGLSEFIKTLQNPELQQPHFSALIATCVFEDLIDNNVDVGTAFRNARNSFMEDAESEFYWTPPLSLDIQTKEDLELYQNNLKLTSETGDNLCMEKKYTCQLEYNVIGDPAFNPYEPVNEG